VQVPPNLAPVEEVLECGVDDLGGVSPVTDDHINPDYAWPALRELEELADSAGVPLRERLPVYERFLSDGIGAGGRRGRGERDRGERSSADDRNSADDRTDDTEAVTGNEWVSDRIAGAIDAESEAGNRYRAVLAGRSTEF
jgi:FO synthase subunit 1